MHTRRSGRGRLTTAGRATSVTSARLAALVALCVMFQRQRVMVVPVCRITQTVARVRLGLGVCGSVDEWEAQKNQKWSTPCCLRCTHSRHHSATVAGDSLADHCASGRAADNVQRCLGLGVRANLDRWQVQVGHAPAVSRLCGREGPLGRDIWQHSQRRYHMKAARAGER